MSELAIVLKNPVVHGVLVGAMGAATADFHAFLQWKKLDDAKTYDWGTALLRWLQGAAVGAVTAAGYGVVTT